MEKIYKLTDFLRLLGGNIRSDSSVCENAFVNRCYTKSCEG